jgi:SOS response regulatory protein OraA/RecX
LQRRFPDFNYSSAPAKERRRVVHFLQRRGFAIGRIMDQLTRKGFETHDENG